MDTRPIYPPLEKVPWMNYKIVVVGGTTDGLTDLFSNVDFQSSGIAGHSLLIKSMQFVPRFGGNVENVKQVQYQGEAAGNDYYLISPNLAVGGNSRVITANVDIAGLNIKFLVNGGEVPIIVGPQGLIFDAAFDNMNLFFPQRIQTLEMYADGFITEDVTTGDLSRYYLEVIFEFILDPK